MKVAQLTFLTSWFVNTFMHHCTVIKTWFVCIAFFSDIWMPFFKFIDYLRNESFTAVRVSKHRFVPKNLRGIKNQCRNSELWPFLSGDPICVVESGIANRPLTFDICIVPRCLPKSKNWKSYWVNPTLRLDTKLIPKIFSVSLLSINSNILENGIFFHKIDTQIKNFLNQILQ